MKRLMLFVLLSCASQGQRVARDPLTPLEAVAAVHGGTGPWAVAGFRMGQAALKTLGLEPGSFSLVITHYAPREVQYSCIADGAAAATGASVGKLNLSLETADVEATRTMYRNRDTGREVVLRVTARFKAKFLNVPREQLDAVGAQVLSLKDEEIFEVVQ